MRARMGALRGACAPCRAFGGLRGAWVGVFGVGRQASVNPKAETVEELQGRRKNLHLGMMKLAREDLALLLHAAHDASVVTCPSPRSGCLALAVVLL
jgi:hypothetical protein